MHVNLKENASTHGSKLHCTIFYGWLNLMADTQQNIQIQLLLLSGITEHVCMY